MNIIKNDHWISPSAMTSINIGDSGARLIVLDVPAGITFGIDAMSYTTGKQFRGVRSIPLGLHFCHYSVGGGDEQQSNGYGGRHGFFFLASSPDDVVVWRWDKLLEDLVPCSRGGARSSGTTGKRPTTSSSSSSAGGGLPEGSLMALEAASLRGELDATLGPYPVDTVPLWSELTSCVSEGVLRSCDVALGVKVLPSLDDTTSGGGGSGLDLLDGGDGFEEDEEDEDQEQLANAEAGLDSSTGPSSFGKGDDDEDDDQQQVDLQTMIDGCSPVFPRAEPPRPKLRRKLKPAQLQQPPRDDADYAGGAAAMKSKSATAKGDDNGDDETGGASKMGGDDASFSSSSYETTQQGRQVAALAPSKRTAWATDRTPRVLALLDALKHSMQHKHANFSSKTTSTVTSSTAVSAAAAAAAASAQRGSSNSSSSSKSHSEGGGGDGGRGGSGEDWEEEQDWERVLGEVQLSFLLFSLCFSLPALRHWKRRLALLSGCSASGIAAEPRLRSLFARLYHATTAQLEFVPSDFFAADQLTHGNFLEPCLRNLLLNASLALQLDTEKEEEKNGLAGGGVADAAVMGDDAAAADGGGGGGHGGGGGGPMVTAASVADLAVGRDRLLAATRARFSLFLEPSSSSSEPSASDSSSSSSSGAGLQAGRRSRVGGGGSSDLDGVDEGDDDEDDDDDDGGVDDDDDEDLSGPSGFRGGGGGGAGLSSSNSSGTTSISSSVSGIDMIGPEPPPGHISNTSAAHAFASTQLLPGFTGFEEEDELPVVVSLDFLSLRDDQSSSFSASSSSSSVSSSMSTSSTSTSSTGTSFGIAYTGGSAAASFAALMGRGGGDSTARKNKAALSPPPLPRTFAGPFSAAPSDQLHGPSLTSVQSPLDGKLDRAAPTSAATAATPGGGGGALGQRLGQPGELVASEEAKVAARYPSLAKALRVGQEDLLMAARRIVDEDDAQQQQHARGESSHRHRHQATATSKAKPHEPLSSTHSQLPSSPISSSPVFSALASPPPPLSSSPEAMPPPPSLSELDAAAASSFSSRLAAQHSSHSASAWLSPTLIEIRGEGPLHNSSSSSISVGSALSVSPNKVAEAAAVVLEASAFLEEQVAQEQSEYWQTMAQGTQSLPTLDGSNDDDDDDDEKFSALLLASQQSSSMTLGRGESVPAPAAHLDLDLD